MLLCAALGAPAPALAHANGSSSEEAKEYQVKAVFLYNFINYTTWIDAEPVGPEVPVTVAVIGPNPFGSDLQTLLDGKRMNGRSFVVEHYPELPDELAAEVVFTSHPSAKFRGKVLEALEGKQTLVVGEHTGFAASGAHISFYMEKSRIRFEINTRAVKRSELSISSQLLKLARIIEEERE